MTALTDDAVVDALRLVEDPELGRSIVDLGMVTGTRVDPDQVAVRIAVPVEDYPQPSAAALAHRIKQAVTSLPGAPPVDRVRVDAVLMTDEQRLALAHALGAGPEQLQRLATRTRVLAIASGKGGVGKSSVTVNLAVALAKRGHKVGILDADVYGFSVPAMLGVDRNPLLVERIIVPPITNGVRCISMGFFVDEDQAVIWRGPMLHKALEQFLTDVWWGDPDILLVDMPPGTGDVALTMAQYLPRAEVYIVTTPNASAQRVAQRTSALADKVSLPVKGVIENMSWFTGDDGKRYEIFGEGGGAELAEKVGVPLLGQVPIVPELREGGDIGLPIVVSEPDGEAAAAFDRIAAAIEADAPKRIYRSELKVV